MDTVIPNSGGTPVLGCKPPTSKKKPPPQPESAVMGVLCLAIRQHLIDYHGVDACEVSASCSKNCS